MKLNILFHCLYHWVYHRSHHWVCHCSRFSWCYWGQTVWSIMFLSSIPWNLIGMGRKNWIGWRSEYQERQALGFTKYLGWWWYVWVGHGVLMILLCTQWWSIYIMCLSSELCGLGLGSKHRESKRIPRIIWCIVVCHSIHGYLWRVN